jgi:hypothetical protein
MSYLPNPSFPTNLQAFVDKSGHDNTGQVGSISQPFLTIGAAVAAVVKAMKMQPGAWVINVGPGIYMENVILPAGVNLQGSVVQANISGSLDVTADPALGAVIMNVSVVAANQPALIIESGHVSVTNSFFSSNWTDNSDNQASVVTKTVGASLILNSTGVFSFTTGSVGTSSLFLSAGEMVINQCYGEYTTNGHVKLFVGYNSSGMGAKIKIQQGSIMLTSKNANVEKIVIYRNNQSNIYAVGNRADIIAQVGAENVTQVGLVQAIGGAQTTLLSQNLGFGSNLPTSAMFYGEGIINNLDAPSLVAEGTNFYTTPAVGDIIGGEGTVPPFVGTFASVSQSSFNKSGSLALSGSLQTGAKRVTTSYIAQINDGTVLVDADVKTTVTLPGNSNGLGAGRVPNGLLMIIKNSPRRIPKGHESSKGPIGCNEVRVKGPIAGGNITLNPGEAVTFQFIEGLWYGISSY